jgi:hypothetical protein
MARPQQNFEGLGFPRERMGAFVTGTVVTCTQDVQEVQRPPVSRRALLPTGLVAAYLTLGFVAYWPLLPSISNRLFGQGADYVLSAWFIGWVPHAIGHELNPFFTNAMFVPTGSLLLFSDDSLGASLVRGSLAVI